HAHTQTRSHRSHAPAPFDIAREKPGAMLPEPGASGALERIIVVTFRRGAPPARRRRTSGRRFTLIAPGAAAVLAQHQRHAIAVDKVVNALHQLDAEPVIQVGFFRDKAALVHGAAKAVRFPLGLAKGLRPGL